MTMIALSRETQSQLGQTSTPVNIRAYRLRQRALKIAPRERRWLQHDRLPESPADRATLVHLSPGVAVLERIAPYRTGVIVDFGFLVRHGKTPIVEWDNGSDRSFALPQWLSLQREQLSLF